MTFCNPSMELGGDPMASIVSSWCQSESSPPKTMLLSAAMVFWDNTSNTFNFRMGPMTFIMLDLAWLYGLGPFVSFKVIDLECFPEGLGLSTSALGFLSRENAWAA